MTKAELIKKIEAAKTNKVIPEKFRADLVSMYEQNLENLIKVETIDKLSNTARHNRNLSIIHGFYNNNQTFVTKEELIAKGFEFVEFFSTSELKQFFDNEENAFEYKDFKCGVYYIKTRDKNLEKPGEKARLFFQIIKLDFERLPAEFARAIKLLRERKYAAGSYWSYSFDSDIQNEVKAKRAEKELRLIESQIKSVIPELKKVATTLYNNYQVFNDLIVRLEAKETEDENWI